MYLFNISRPLNRAKTMKINKTYTYLVMAGRKGSYWSPFLVEYKSRERSRKDQDDVVFSEKIVWFIFPDLLNIRIGKQINVFQYKL